MLILWKTDACRISISEHHYPHLESLHLKYNDELTEIEELPVNLENLHVQRCPELKKLPSFERLTSLREFVFEGCDQIKKIDGLEGCTRLEILNLNTCWEGPGIESLKRMENLRRVELRAERGSAIESCIGTIQNWPDEIIVYARMVSDASSIIDSFKLGLSPSLCVVDSCSMDISSIPKLCSPNSCYIINAASGSYFQLNGSRRGESYVQIEEGRRALIGVFARHSLCPYGEGCPRLFECYRLQEEWFGWPQVHAEVERQLTVSGEKKMLVEAIMPLFQSIWR